MKWAVVILLVLGLLTAGSTAVLFGWVQARNAKAASQNTPVVSVLVAQADLPARTRVAAEQVKVDQVPRTGLPAGYFTNQAQAIGKTLKVAVAKGQPLTGSCFLSETAIDDLLKPGMLAFQISLTRRSTAVDLLYPGCIVDVFATFPLQDRKRGDAVVTPLLQNIQVLGVRDQTVVSTRDEKNGTKKSASPSGDVTVALEVNARQAAALQLAMEKGTLGLAMRNPLDKNPNPIEPMVMKEGQLTASSEAMDPATLMLYNKLQEMLGNKPLVDVNSPPVARAVVDPNSNPAEGLGGLPERKSTVTITVIRGSKVEEAQVKQEQKEGEEAPPAEAKEAGV